MRELLGKDVVFKEITGRKRLGQRLGLSVYTYSRLLEYIEERIAFAKFGL